MESSVHIARRQIAHDHHAVKNILLKRPSISSQYESIVHSAQLVRLTQTATAPDETHTNSRATTHSTVLIWAIGKSESHHETVMRQDWLPEKLRVVGVQQDCMMIHLNPKTKARLNRNMLL
jgi:hypothetical protein